MKNRMKMYDYLPFLPTFAQGGYGDTGQMLILDPVQRNESYECEGYHRCPGCERNVSLSFCFNFAGCICCIIILICLESHVFYH